MTAAPTTELGVQTPAVPGLQGWSSWTPDELERVPELMWPLSVRLYHTMRTDGQIQGLYLGTTLPIRRFKWSIDRNGAKPEIVEKISEDLNLPIQGEDPKPRGRTKRRFVFDEHLKTALLAILYGHRYFEQVGEVDADEYWRLRKLSDRPPNTINEINVSPDGGLNYIKQYIGVDPKPIPVGRLVAYVWDKDGARWEGRSMLRACYRNWLRKDRLLRVDAIKHERNGMGVPVGTAPPNATDAQMRSLSDMARRLKAGDTSGGSIPAGSDMKLLGVSGTLPDTIASIRLDNEEMARSWLMMFMQLGQTETGSRALGSEFIDFFGIGLEAIAGWFRDTFNEHVIEDWVDWNYGEDEQAPLLTFEKDEDPVFVISDLARLIHEGAIVVDPEIEDWLRQRLGAPAKPAGEQPAPGPPKPSPSPGPGSQDPQSPPATARQRVRRTVTAADLSTSPVSLPSRPLRRQPYEQEVIARTDFARLDSDYETTRDALVGEVRVLQEQQINELHDAIVGANGDLEKIADVAATPNASDAIHARLVDVATRGAKAAVDEAREQGKEDAKLPKLDALFTNLSDRAASIANILSSSLSQSARANAIRLSGGKLSPSEVAGAVKTHLQGLSGSYLTDQLGGGIQAAINSGRRVAMGQNDATRIYASEILDLNTCGECIGVDGTEYVSMDDAEKDYSSGGFNDCAGGPRCRGTLIAVYGETVATLE